MKIPASDRLSPGEVGTKAWQHTPARTRARTHTKPVSSTPCHGVHVGWHSGDTA